MEFAVKKSALLKELSLTQGVVEKKTTIPILANLLLEASESRLRISATDLELGIHCGCEAKTKKSGSGTVPAKRLLEIVRSLPEAEVKFKLLENHWVQVTCERSSFKLVGMARDTYPALPAVPNQISSLPADVMAKMIERTIFSISSEESRYTLNGALLILKPESAMMVATDGHRLAIIERKVEIGGLRNELRILIPKKALSELGRLLAEAGKEGKVQFSKDENHLFFAVEDRTLIARMLTGQFPNYEAVLPRENKRVVDLDRVALTDAIRRVALLADERSRAIRIQLEKDKIEIFSSSGEFGEAHETLEADFPGDPLQIGFNYQYLVDFLSVISDSSKIRLELKDEQSAGQLRPLDGQPYEYRYVVMPMRV